MKKNLFVRVLSALGSLMLWALGVLALAEMFFHVPVTAFAGRILSAGTPLMVLLVLLAVLAAFVLGFCGLLMLSSKRATKHNGFVMQKGENGMIGVSIKSIEGLVQTCVKQHEKIAKADIAVAERRDGIVILLSIEEAAGMNIPLAVGALQKQIKQYVGTCTGVDVHEVRVMVENTEDNVTESPYAVEKPVALTTAATAAEMHREAASAVEPEVQAPVLEVAAPVEDAVIVEEIPVLEISAAEEAVEEESVQEAVAAPTVNIPVVPVAPIIPVMPEIIEEEDDRPLHQRLFGAEEQPVFVPAPPELVMEPQAEETVEESTEEIVEAAEEEAPEAEGIDANSVLEVVEAIAQEEAQAEADESEYAAEELADYDEEVLAEEASLDGADEEEIRE